MKNALSQPIPTETILADSPLFAEIHHIVAENQPLVAELNNGYKTPE